MPRAEISDRLGFSYVLMRTSLCPTAQNTPAAAAHLFDPPTFLDQVLGLLPVQLLPATRTGRTGGLSASTRTEDRTVTPAYLANLVTPGRKVLGLGTPDLVEPTRASRACRFRGRAYTKQYPVPGNNATNLPSPAGESCCFNRS